MKKEEFLVALEDILQREESCNQTDMLADYEEWDSLSKMATMAYYDKNFGIKIKLSEISQFKTVQDLINLAGDQISD